MRNFEVLRSCVSVIVGATHVPVTWATLGVGLGHGAYISPEEKGAGGAGGVVCNLAI